ncbi:hypothetical protein BZG36_04576 [Bifiguratus adelaidae]|uniref:Uncharacterized protein n=1 Tax=Bifiguratus adelaidae TaxID=1938954 RepID=A0A261XUR9_9FUNG|nr:hypothetical protein BZG36_04576 [Bifiguratus adelaidae]
MDWDSADEGNTQATTELLEALKARLQSSKQTKLKKRLDKGTSILANVQKMQQAMLSRQQAEVESKIRYARERINTLKSEQEELQGSIINAQKALEASQAQTREKLRDIKLSKGKLMAAFQSTLQSPPLSEMD